MFHTIFIFAFCIFTDGSCEREIVIKQDYDACIAAQLEYMKDHEGEDVYTLCRRLPELRT